VKVDFAFSLVKSEVQVALSRYDIEWDQYINHFSLVYIVMAMILKGKN
jgi:hypothetical protein